MWTHIYDGDLDGIDGEQYIGAPINKKNMPPKSQQRFYSFLMTGIIPRILKLWNELQNQEKYFFDKPGMCRWYKFRIKLYVDQGDYLMAIIMAAIVLFQKENNG